jgi:hypothetical protein
MQRTQTVRSSLPEVATLRRTPPSNNEMQLTGGDGSSRQWGSPFGEPVPRSRRQASPPAADLGVLPTEGERAWDRGGLAAARTRAADVPQGQGSCRASRGWWAIVVAAIYLPSPTHTKLRDRRKWIPRGKSARHAPCIDSLRQSAKIYWVRAPGCT